MFVSGKGNAENMCCSSRLSMFIIAVILELMFLNYAATGARNASTGADGVPTEGSHLAQVFTLEEILTRLRHLGGQ